MASSKKRINSPSKGSAAVSRNKAGNQVSQKLVRAATPSSRLFVLKAGGKSSKNWSGAVLKAATLLGRIDKVTSKPGVSRNRVFRSGTPKKVFGYWVYPKD